MKYLLSALLLTVAVACGESATTGDTENNPPSSSRSESHPDSTVGEGETTTSGIDETSTTTSDREVAPEFTLKLGDGGTYTLSEGSKPVYLVFWAEW